MNELTKVPQIAPIASPHSDDDCKPYLEKVRTFDGIASQVESVSALRPLNALVIAWRMKKRLPEFERDRENALIAVHYFAVHFQQNYGQLTTHWGLGLMAVPLATIGIETANVNNSSTRLFNAISGLETRAAASLAMWVSVLGLIASMFLPQFDWAKMSF